MWILKLGIARQFSAVSVLCWIRNITLWIGYSVQANEIWTGVPSNAIKVKVLLDFADKNLQYSYLLQAGSSTKQP